jgi:hypothetical protein
VIIIDIPHERPALPVANYSSAIARAVDWLGDRYLLAHPVNVAHGHDGVRAAQAASHTQR